MDKTMLTARNYYSREANKAYFSVSQVKGLMHCPAAAMAELNGTYYQEKTVPLLVGGYVDAYFSGESDEFIKANPEIFNARTGELKAEFKKAKDIINRLMRDDLVKRIASQSDTQKIVTGNIAGYPFKAKLDFWLDDNATTQIATDYPDLSEMLYADGAIIDLKVMKDFQPIFVPGGGRQHFIEAWQYDLQLAVYQELMRQQIGSKVPCYILAATKEHAIGMELFRVEQDVLDQRLDELVERLDELNAIKVGKTKAIGCGDCQYCRLTKRLTGAVSIEGEE